MEAELAQLGLRSCRDDMDVTGSGSNNCVYHAVIGFHIGNYFVTVPEDCIDASRPEGQQFALSDFEHGNVRFPAMLRLNLAGSGVSVATQARHWIIE